MKSLLKVLLPDRMLRMPILLGPFRGARVQLNPRQSVRMMLGLYEHELTGWLKAVMPQVNLVLDVGANAGYFSLGCAARWRRLGKAGEIIAFEPDLAAFENLQAGAQAWTSKQIRISLNQCFVGDQVGPNITTLDAIAEQRGGLRQQENALIKIDVEGAELDVIAGASLWLNPKNYFLIEVHQESFLETLVKLFAARGMKLKQVDQKPLPILGYETRSRENWWLVSDLSQSS